MASIVVLEVKVTSSQVVALLLFMFVSVVTWLVTVPVRHLGRSYTYYQSWPPCLCFVLGMSIALDGSSGGQTGTSKVSSLNVFLCP